MKQVLALVVVSLSLFAAYKTGSSVNQQHDQLFGNVCLIDQTNVNLLEQSLANITKADERTYGVKRIQKARRLTIRYIHKYASIAPCTVRVRIPKAPS